MSHPAPRSTKNDHVDPFGPATEEEMEANLKRIDAMEEDQEVTSRLQAGFTMGELQSSAIPNSVIPSNVRFLSYENMKKSVTCSPATMQHPCTTKKYTSVMIRVCHSRSRFLSCMYIHDKFMTESR